MNEILWGCISSIGGVGICKWLTTWLELRRGGGIGDEGLVLAPDLFNIVNSDFWRGDPLNEDGWEDLGIVRLKIFNGIKYVL